MITQEEIVKELLKTMPVIPDEYLKAFIDGVRFIERKLKEK